MRRAALIAFLALLTAMTGPSLARACAVQLVFAVDVSGSVDRSEHALQVRGLASAFRDEEVIRLISSLEGGVRVTMMQWSGAPHQLQSTPWMRVTDATSAERFALSVEGAHREFEIYSTAIGNALDAADYLMREADFGCRRRVIDVSGDGVNNEGAEPRPISLGLAMRGVVVNGLVIKGATPDPERYYLKQVITGIGSFVEVANGFDDIGRAFRRKILRELSPRHAWRAEPVYRIARDAAASGE